MKSKLTAPDRSALDPAEVASRDELSALQLQRLKWTLRHTYDNVEHYRKKFQAAGVTPDDLKSLDDLRHFPFTTKEDLRQTYPFGMFAVPMDKIVRVHASSGTTGRPTVVGYTKKDIATWAQCMARALRGAGVRPGHKLQNAYGYGLFTGGLGAHYGAEELGCAVIPMSGGQTEKQIQLIREFRPDVITVTPSYMLVLLDAMEAEGMDPRECSLACGVFGAEPWTEAMRAEIERRAGMDAIDIYGLSEVMGPGVACECLGGKEGPYIFEDHFYPEIIHPETGLPVADGEAGELVFTTLTKEALPVIRYRTRDLSRLLPGTVRTFRRIGKITGRSDDMLIIRGVNVFPSQVEEQILKVDWLSPHYLLQVDRTDHLDEMTVKVEMRPEVMLNEQDRRSAANELKHNIKTFVGVTTKIEVLEPESLPRSLGKAKRVIDNRSKS
jgi:phenylacetate-CoA ligase